MRRVRTRRSTLEDLDSGEVVVISGRYQGRMVFPNDGSYLLDLRIDVDKRYNNYPIMNRISGDIYRIQNTTDPEMGPSRSSDSQVYLES